MWQSYTGLLAAPQLEALFPRLTRAAQYEMVARRHATRAIAARPSNGGPLSGTAEARLQGARKGADAGARVSQQLRSLSQQLERLPQKLSAQCTPPAGRAPSAGEA